MQAEADRVKLPCQFKAPQHGAGLFQDTKQLLLHIFRMGIQRAPPKLPEAVFAQHVHRILQRGCEQGGYAVHAFLQQLQKLRYGRGFPLKKAEQLLQHIAEGRRAFRLSLFGGKPAAQEHERR